MVATPQPVETILFAQHGWADSNQAMQRLGDALADAGTRVIAPSLGYVRTWLRIEPLIEIAERAAEQALSEHPAARIRAVGHSMGGLIWIELLTRHPDWLLRIDRLALVGCPVGGANLAGVLDPLGLTIGRDLRVNRRTQAEAVAMMVPTLCIVGDLIGPHDGTVSHESSRLANARFVVAPSASHAALRHSPWVTRLIRAFFEQPDPPSTDHAAIIAELRRVPGIIPAEPHLARLATVFLMLTDGCTVRLLNAVPGVDLVFVADGQGVCQYAGAVPWPNGPALRRALDHIRERALSTVLPA
jgi:pimeloyl-ACP methyl ester carboxylesterase